jgi:hypothetical protein
MPRDFEFQPKRRDFKAENRRAFVKHVCREFTDERRTKLLLRDLDTVLWRETYRREGATDHRFSVIANLRYLANALEESGKDFTKAEILIGLG